MTTPRTYVLYSEVAGGIVVSDPATTKRVYINYGSFAVDVAPPPPVFPVTYQVNLNLLLTGA